MRYDAAIVLANLMDAQGQLNDESRARMAKAVEAYHHKVVPLLVTCGWAYREDCALPIANAMRDYAVIRGRVPFADVLAETTSRDTVGDAVFTKRNFATPRGWTRILVVTSDYHVVRTKAIFGFVYGNGYLIEAIGAQTCEPAERAKTEQASTTAFRLTFQGVSAGDDEAILARLVERHPFYNGAVHPKL